MLLKDRTPHRLLQLKNAQSDRRVLELAPLFEIQLRKKIKKSIRMENVIKQLARDGTSSVDVGIDCGLGFLNSTCELKLRRDRKCVQVSLLSLYCFAEFEKT